MKPTTAAVVAVLAVCVTMCLSAHPLKAGPPPHDVVVDNGAANPVPVSLGAPVTVNGTVRAVLGDNPTPVSRVAILGMATGDSRQNIQTVYTVPAGKRLVIQSETAYVEATGVKTEVYVTTVHNNGDGVFYALLPQVDRGFWEGQGEIYEGSSAIPMFADAGETVQAQLFLNVEVIPPASGVRAEIGFSGYLVDLPQ